MWTPVVSNNLTYLLKVTKNENEICAFLTDLKNVWHENINFIDAYDRFQDINPIYDTNCEEAIEQILNLTSNSEKYFHINVNESATVSIKSKLAEISIKFEFKLSLGSADDFYKEVTVPLIKTVKCLEDQQNHLINLLERKDREIEEHVMQSGDISRKHLVTEKYDASTSCREIQDDKLMLNTFGKWKRFWEIFAKDNGDIKHKIKMVNQTDGLHQKKKMKIYSSETCSRSNYSKIKFKDNVQ